jgi:peptide/nickel transport system permease protein
MPIFCLSIGLVASVARQTRSNMLEVISQDYIRTARANGISERSVIFRHALKNAMIPVVTIIGMQVRIVIGGSLIVEQIFNISGIGLALTSAISNRDYWVVQGCVLMISLFTVTCNLVIDILYGLIDPRIRRARS